MANPKIQVEIGARTDELTSKLKNAQSSLQDFAGKAQKIGAALSVGVTLPLIAIGAKAIRNFNQQAQALGQVEVALKSTGNAAGRTSKQLQDTASALQANSLFGDEEILQKVTAQLLTFTNIAGTAFDRTQKAALDLATRLGGDLQGATIQLGKALNDPIANLSALSRSGIQFSEAQKDLIKSLTETNRLSEAQAIILDELERQYGGSAEAAAKLGTGPLQQLSNQFGDLLEDIGGIIIQGLNPLISKISKLISFFQNLSPATKTIIVSVAALAGAIGPLLLGVGSFIKLLPLLSAGLTAAKVAFTALTGPVGLAVAAISGAAILIISNWDKITDAFKNSGISESFDDLKTEFVGLGREIGSSLSSLGQTFSEFGTQLITKLTPVINFIVNQFAKKVKFALDQLTQVFGIFKNLLEGDFDTAFKRLQLLGLTLFKSLTESFSGFLRLIPGLGDKIDLVLGNVDKKISSLTAVIEGREAFKNISTNAEEATESTDALVKSIESVGRAFESIPSINLNRPSAPGTGSPSGPTRGVSDKPKELTFFEQLEKDLEDRIPTIEERLQTFAFAVDDILFNSIAGSFSDLGTSIGEAIAEGGSIIGAVGKSLLKSISGFLGQLGDQLIQFGIAGGAFGKLSLALTNPLTAVKAAPLAIAAGIALKAISGAIGSIGQRGPGGGAGSVGTSGVGGAGSTFTGGGTGGLFESNREIRGELVARGTDLVYVFERTNERINKG